jgi:hypothetical protein
VSKQSGAALAERRLIADRALRLDRRRGLARVGALAHVASARGQAVDTVAAHLGASPVDQFLAVIAQRCRGAGVVLRPRPAGIARALGPFRQRRDGVRQTCRPLIVLQGVLSVQVCAAWTQLLLSDSEVQPLVSSVFEVMV